MDAGYGVYLCEYRGFGGNPGSISEEGFYKDARAALRWLETNGYASSQWVIYGESIGSGSAVQMAAEFQPKMLILEGAFSSALDVAKERYFWLPVSYMLKDKFDNISKIKSIHSSLLMLHGEGDPTVPLHSAQKLYEAANQPKQFSLIRGGGHNNLYDFGAGQVILEWLAKSE
ncbi:MAG: alpha/beta hydrolase [Proteobacteria bacterium]|nr:alpha/beta hydrolase [Pseudomonadota bacterium]